eukprot:gnl/Trimastix_PCT/2240.p1 GENE.gnl/Trimastix_PCT/2240~~gnl/Trimastix_PCT/2240.p1  ORF type:complete len:632 (-),score=145.42 gnl/Trimastix_PCT/2240:340-2235(-)
MRKASQTSTIRSRTMKSGLNSKVSERNQVLSVVETINVNVTNYPARHNLCLEILKQGCVDSFVDFFNLTHAANPETKKRTDTPPDSADLFEHLDFLKEQLTEAELAGRQEREEDVFNAVQSIASYFEKLGHFDDAIRFHLRCHHAAQLSGNVMLQVEASHALAFAYERIGMLPEAIHYHEQHLQRAEVAHLPDHALNAKQHLITVYERLADQAESTQDFESAIASLDKCLVMAEQSRNITALGQTHYRLGLIYEHIGDVHRAVQCQKQFLSLCQESNNSEGSDLACGALARCYQRQNDFESAIQYLQMRLNLTEQHDLETELERQQKHLEDTIRSREHSLNPPRLSTGGASAPPSPNSALSDQLASREFPFSPSSQHSPTAAQTANASLAAQREACASLGVIYNRQGKYANAVRLFRKNFDISRTQQQQPVTEDELARSLVLPTGAASVPPLQRRLLQSDSAQRARKAALAATQQSRDLGVTMDSLEGTGASDFRTPEGPDNAAILENRSSVMDQAKVSLAIARGNKNLRAFCHAMRQGDAGLTSGEHAPTELWVAQQGARSEEELDEEAMNEDHLMQALEEERRAEEAAQAHAHGHPYHHPGIPEDMISDTPVTGSLRSSLRSEGVMIPQ